MTTGRGAAAAILTPPTDAGDRRYSSKPAERMMATKATLMAEGV